MADKFKIGDQVTWNSEAGYVSGSIVKIHSHDFDHKGYTHHASADDPQYEIKSGKTGHIAMHKGSALKNLLGEMARAWDSRRENQRKRPHPGGCTS